MNEIVKIPSGGEFPSRSLEILILMEGRSDVEFQSNSILFKLNRRTRTATLSSHLMIQTINIDLYALMLYTHTHIIYNWWWIKIIQSKTYLEQQNSLNWKFKDHKITKCVKMQHIKLTSVCRPAICEISWQMGISAFCSTSLLLAYSLKSVVHNQWSGPWYCTYSKLWV